MSKDDIILLVDLPGFDEEDAEEIGKKMGVKKTYTPKSLMEEGNDEGND